MNRKRRTLILTQTDPENDFMFHTWVENGYLADIIFKPAPKIVRAFRRIWIRHRLPARGIWYGGWKKQLEKYDAMIIHASSLTRDLPRWIHQKNPNIRIIYWYWNKVDQHTIPVKRNGDQNVEYWSFDEKDCKKYQMKKNIQYYSVPLLGIWPEQNIENDIYFIGHDVGRKKQILEVRRQAQKQGLVCDFHIIGDKKLVVPYQEVQRQVLRSRAILEINRSGQCGFTLRTMESLFFNKKLITDNIALLDAPFYRKSNIFIVDYDNMDDLKKFLEIPYDESVCVYKEQYSLDRWFNNFFISETAN